MFEGDVEFTSRRGGEEHITCCENRPVMTSSCTRIVADQAERSGEVVSAQLSVDPPHTYVRSTSTKPPHQMACLTPLACYYPLSSSQYFFVFGNSALLPPSEGTKNVPRRE